MWDSVVLWLWPLTVCTYVVNALYIEGKDGAFAQFERWGAGLNGSLELEFRTNVSNGLLLYTDDGGHGEFFLLELLDGSMQLTFNLGGREQKINVGGGLNDNEWHRVEISRSNDVTKLTVDYIMGARTSSGPEFYFGDPRRNSPVFIGGISKKKSELLEAHSPRGMYGTNVLLKPRFVGKVRNVVYTGPDGKLERRTIQSYKVCY